jgi:hypothetical protein
MKQKRKLQQKPTKSRAWLEAECLKLARRTLGGSEIQRVTIRRLHPKGMGPNWKVADIAADATGHPVERIPEDREQNKGQAMEIERTTFGAITIDGKTYEHDVIIRLSGEVVKRKKKLSKKYYGTSHVLSKDEAKFVFERGCEQLILGSGQMGNVHLSPEAEAYFAKKGCTVLLQPTPEAIGAFNRSHAKKIGLFHVTC